MDDLIHAGYNARRKGNEKQELQFFNMWKEQERMQNESLDAEIHWEKRLSDLKMRNPRGSASDLGWNDF